MASWTQEIRIFVHKTCNSLSTEAYDFVAIKNRIKSKDGVRFLILSFRLELDPDRHFVQEIRIFVHKPVTLLLRSI